MNANTRTNNYRLSGLIAAGAVLAVLASAFVGATSAQAAPATAQPFVCSAETTTTTPGYVKRVLVKQIGRTCIYKLIKAPVFTPVEPVTETPAPVAPAPVVVPEPVAPAPVVVPAPQPVAAPAPVVVPAPVGGTVSNDPLVVKYAQFAATFPGTLKYGVGGSCFKMNYGFVQNGTFPPSFKTGNGVSAQVKLTVNSARSGFDVQWYACQ